MSDEMAVGDNATNEDGKVNGDEAASASTVSVEPPSSEPPSDPAAAEAMETDPQPDEVPKVPKEEKETPPETPEAVSNAVADQVDGAQEAVERGIKRRASAAFSDNGADSKGFLEDAKPDEQFKGFDSVDQNDVSIDYGRVVERLEAEITEAKKTFTPIKTITAPMPIRASKRPRQDTGTDGSRPSSALSSRSESDGGLLAEVTSATSSPAQRGRRSTTEMSSPLLRVPLERGWKRELVYRAALDAHSRRNADIYYYTPQGKKLRSTREVAENLSGTGLTLENFSFFKEPLGIDDPEREIIRDAKLMRRMDSPVTSPAPTTEGKRTPKPKPPKGVDPEPATPKSPPAKIKVKSVGSRLSGSGPAPPTNNKQQKKQQTTTTTTTPAADNNNSAAWKKPRPPASAPAATVAPPAASVAPPAVAVPPPAVTAPPPLQSRPPVAQTSPDVKSPRQVVQPCSLTCGRGVPSLSCAACLCLYHPYCAGYVHTTPPDNFYCKNCSKAESPSRSPPPLLHKSGVPGALPAQTRRPPPSASTTTGKQTDKRVLLRMKVAGGGPDGERVWAVTPHPPPKPPQPPKPVPMKQPRPAPRPRPPARAPPRPAAPQSLAVFNGRRFIVVPRNMVQPNTQP